MISGSNEGAYISFRRFATSLSASQCGFVVAFGRMTWTGSLAPGQPRVISYWASEAPYMTMEFC